MKCHVCGFENEEGFAFCENCGSPLNQSESEEPVLEEEVITDHSESYEPADPYFVQNESEPEYEEEQNQPQEDTNQAPGNPTKMPMNKGVLIGGGVLFALIAGFLIYSFVFKGSEPEPVIEETIAETAETEEDDDTTSIKTTTEKKETVKTPVNTKQKDTSVAEKQDSSQVKTGNSSDSKTDVETYSVSESTIPTITSMPVYAGNGHYIFESGGKYGIIDDQGNVLISPTYDEYYIREISQTEKETVPEFKGYFCVMDSKTQSGTDAIELTPCSRDQSFPWYQDFVPRVIATDGSIVDAYGGLTNSPNYGLYRDWQYNMSHTIVSAADYADTSNEGNQIFYIYSEKVDRLFGPYNPDEKPFFEMKRRLVRNNYSVDTIFYDKEDGKYRIYSGDATESYPTLFDSAVPVSDNYMMVTKDGKTGLVDKDFTVIWFDNATEVSAISNGRAYAKVNGVWQLVDVN